MNSHSRLEGPSRACEALARHILSGFSDVIHTSCDYILNDLPAFYAQLYASKAVAVSFCEWLKYTVKMRHAIQSLFEPPRHSTNRQPCQWTTITGYIRRLPPARFFVQFQNIRCTPNRLCRTQKPTHIFPSITINTSICGYSFKTSCDLFAAYGTGSFGVTICNICW